MVKRNRSLIDRNVSDTAALALIGFIVVIAVIAINITVVVFAVINGFALFGPDGDIASVWHWIWFVLCCVFLLGGIFSRTK